MGGLSNAFWFWFPVFLFKTFGALFRTGWKLNLWILQTICGVPLYYCKPEYRIPAIFLGTIGILQLALFLFFLLSLGASYNNNSVEQIGSFLVMGFIGLALLLLCRVLIRQGSL